MYRANRPSITAELEDDAIWGIYEGSVLQERTSPPPTTWTHRDQGISGRGAVHELSFFFQSVSSPNKNKFDSYSKTNAPNWNFRFCGNVCQYTCSESLGLHVSVIYASIPTLTEGLKSVCARFGYKRRGEKPVVNRVKWSKHEPIDKDNEPNESVFNVGPAKLLRWIMSIFGWNMFKQESGISMGTAPAPDIPSEFAFMFELRYV